MNDETIYLPKSFGVKVEDRNERPKLSEILKKGSSRLSCSKLYHTTENFQTRMELEICEEDANSSTLSDIALG